MALTIPIKSSAARKPLKPPEPTGRKILDLWYKAQYQLSKSEIPEIIILTGESLENVGRTRAPTTVIDIQKIIDTRSGIHDEGVARLDAGDFEDDEDENEEEMSLLIKTPVSPKAGGVADRVLTFEMGVGSGPRGGTRLSEPPAPLTTHKMRGKPSVGSTKSTGSDAGSSASDLRRTASGSMGDMVDSTTTRTGRSGGVTAPIDEEKERGHLIRKMFFKAQAQLSTGTQPGILLKYGGGYRILDLKRYNERYKHISGARSHIDDYLSTDWGVARSAKRVHIDADGPEEDDEPSALSSPTGSVGGSAAASPPSSSDFAE